MANPNTASWPANAASLPVGVENYSTTLTAPIGTTDVTIPVAVTPANWPTIVTIDNEIILVGTVSGGNLATCTRGISGTAAAVHSSGANVFGYVSAYYINQLAAELTAMQNAWFTPVAACQLWLGANTAFNNGASTLVPFANTQLALPASMVGANNNGAIVVPTAGLYQVGGQVTFANNNTGYRQVTVGVNGNSNNVTPIVRDNSPSNTQYSVVQFQAVLQLNANDVVGVYAAQTSGANLNVLTFANGTNAPTFVSVVKIF